MSSSLISIQNLSKVYSDPENRSVEVMALKNINLELPPLVFGGLLGPSGSGKTTLLNLIAGLDTPSSGRIILGGSEVSKLSSTERSFYRRENLGFIFQSFNLFPSLSVLENIEYTGLIRGDESSLVRGRALHSLELVGMANKRHSRPSELSGGQQQRVAVARALCSHPKTILADEPTANLDSGNAKNLVKLFRDLNETQKVSFLFSTHDARLYESISTKVHMEDGEIIKVER